MNVLDLKTGLCLQKSSRVKSQVAQNILEQTEIISQELRKNSLEAYIKYNAYYDKKASVSKLKERDYVYVLQTKAGHQGSKILFTNFRWTGPCLV